MQDNISVSSSWNEKYLREMLQKTKTRHLCSLQFFPENRANYEIMWNKGSNVRIMLRRGAFLLPFCSGKAVSISYSECAFVALGIQHA